MCSEIRFLSILTVVAVVASCSTAARMRLIRSGDVRVDISVPEDKSVHDGPDREVIIDSMRSDLTGEPIIMNAIRDSETGEMVATDVINASRVVARFRNVAERAGYVSVSFDVIVPAAMSDSRWQLKLYPKMRIQEDTLDLDSVYITGEYYRAQQMRGYQRYRNFLASIITDTADLVRVRQLEIFLERHYPETYAMKSDTSLVPDPVAANLFGVTQADALRHYTRHLRVHFNERKKARSGRMYEKFVKDPIVREGICLDTVFRAGKDDFVYRYVHTFRSRPRLKKVMVDLEGEIYEDGICIQTLPFPEELTFYISSLSTMADMTPKYRMIVLERNVYDNTKALIDFHKGSSDIDTTLGDNASELRRVIRCIGDVVARREYVLDSLIVTASCSPEGTYRHNSRLSAARSESVRKYIWDYVPEEWKDSIRTSHVPENWRQLRLLVENDTVMSRLSRERITALMHDLDSPDEVERSLAAMPEYRYIREKLYPQLRSVSFDFHLHRPGVHKDTVHTAELDTVYMAGLDALRDLDYKKAVEKLRPYRDYNSALACMAADYDHTALDILKDLEDTDAGVCYLKALVLSRLQMYDEAVRYFDLSISYDPYMEHRANLDPEMHVVINERQTLKNKKYE